MGSPNYILVSSLCFSYLCPINFALCYCAFSAVYTLVIIPFVIYPYLVNICIIFCYSYHLARYILQLILVSTCSSCTSRLSYIPSILVQFVLAFLEPLSVYLRPIYSFVLSLLNYILVISYRFFMVIERFIKWSVRYNIFTQIPIVL